MNISEQITVITTTIGRPRVATRCLLDIRTRFPSLRILVADQNGSRIMQNVYECLDVDVLWLEPDVGLSCARNRLFEQVETDFALLTDDDNFPTVGEPFLEALVIQMRDHPQWLTVGGRLPNRRYDFRFGFTPGDKIVVKQMLDESTGISSVVDENNIAVGQDFYTVDAVLNLALMSVRNLRASGLAWDERMKISGEHLDFFLSLHKLNKSRSPKLEVVTCPQFTFQEVPGAKASADYSVLRMRREGSRALSRKWGITGTITSQLGREPRFDHLSRDAVWTQSLSDFARVLDRLGIRWCVSNGTLLGFVREGNFLNHDLDMDVILEVPAESVQSLEVGLSAAGFSFGRVFGTPRTGLEISVMCPTPAFGAWPYGNIKIDMFFLTKRGEKNYTARYKGGLRKWFEYPELKTTKVFIDALGIETKFPVNPEEFLSIEYGPDWRVPDEQWSWWSSPRNAISSEPRRTGLRELVFEYLFYRRNGLLPTFRRLHPRLGAVAKQFGNVKKLWRR